jgi:hypothetical protein
MIGQMQSDVNTVGLWHMEETVVVERISKTVRETETMVLQPVPLL